MPCNDKPTDCTPCKDCPSPAQPILPRCQDISLPPGVYTNAVVTVNENGCISDVVSGEPDPYTPDPCCAAPSVFTQFRSEDQNGPLPVSSYPPAGTIKIGSVSTVSADTPASVVNIGTDSAAVLEIRIPRGREGKPGVGAKGGNLNGPGFVFESGMFISTTPVWPPIYAIDFKPSSNGLIFTSEKDSISGRLSVNVDSKAFESKLRLELQEQLDAQNVLIANLQTLVTELMETTSKENV